MKLWAVTVVIKRQLRRAADKPAEDTEKAEEMEEKAEEEAEEAEDAEAVK